VKSSRLWFTSPRQLVPRLHMNLSGAILSNYLIMIIELEKGTLAHPEDRSQKHNVSKSNIRANILGIF
jgi:hypothetical protein